MIYLLGGPPRVGKTQLALEIVERQPMHVVSTDAIRYMLRRTVPKDALNPDILSPKDDVLNETSQMILNRQNAESVALWPAIKHYIQSYREDGVDLLVEGVAVIPQLVKTLDMPYSCLFVGNLEDHHTETILKMAKNNEYDWLHKYTDDQVIAYANFFKHMSAWFKDESKRNRYTFKSISDDSYIEDIKMSVNLLLDLRA